MQGPSRLFKTTLLGVLLVGSFAMTAYAEESKKPKVPMPDCNTPKHQKLRMLVGTWVVTEDGKEVGRNTLSPVFGDCAVREEWTSANGSPGTSLTFYDSQLDIYRQTWIDSQGIVLELKGGFEGDALVLEGQRPTIQNPAKIVDNRIRWSPNKDGGFQQVWSVSSDGGKTWKQVFNGRYAK